MLRVTAADFTKRFGQYRDLALREPVLVTHHGRDTLVLVSADEYRRLKSFDEPECHEGQASEQARRGRPKGVASPSGLAPKA